MCKKTYAIAVLVIAFMSALLSFIATDPHQLFAINAIFAFCGRMLPVLIAGAFIKYIVCCEDKSKVCCNCSCCNPNKKDSGACQTK